MFIIWSLDKRDAQVIIAKLYEKILFYCAYYILKNKLNCDS